MLHSERLFEDGDLPLYLRTEHIAEHDTHSDLAHWHDHIEIIVVNRGSIICQVNGEAFSLHKGDVCFINHKQFHHLRPGNEHECCHDVLIVSTALLTRSNRVFERCIAPVLDDANFSHVRFEGTSSPAAEIAALVGHIKHLRTLKEPGYELELVADIHSVFYQLFLAHENMHVVSPADANALVLQRMTDYIYSHFDEPISLDDIAHAGGVSRSQCTKLFKRYTSSSPISFVNTYRLEQSRVLLRSYSISVWEVALSSGFKDQSYLNRGFSREYGSTPLSYRRGIV